MNLTESPICEYNRRDFIKGGSVATLMAMLGGVELFAEPAAPSAADAKSSNSKVKVAIIGLGNWGRELLAQLGRIKQADVAALCETYPAFLKRAANNAPQGIITTPDYKTVLENKEIKAVFIATPTHKHKEIALAALKAGKHVYCEAPLAGTIEDAREIALAAKANKQLVFQPGLQLRLEPQRHFLLPFIRSGAIGQPLMARAQWHQKTNWRATSPNPEREKEMNWRLNKETSLGLVGEIGVHQIDQASWFLAGKPKSVTGFGSVAFWKDGRDVPDTVQAMIEFPGGVYLNYDATIANSFDANYELFYGSDAAVMVRGDKAWMFKEVDSPLLGWEVYARKETFYKETGIALVANASKSTGTTEKPAEQGKALDATLNHALEIFLRNVIDVEAAVEAARAGLDPDDKESLAEIGGAVGRRTAPGFEEGYQATVAAIKTHEAIMNNQKVEIPASLYQLG